MRFNNLEVREAISAKGLLYYEVAKLIGVSDTSFSRMLRYELTPERKTEILTAIGGSADDKRRKSSKKQSCS